MPYATEQKLAERVQKRPLPSPFCHSFARLKVAEVYAEQLGC